MANILVLGVGPLPFEPVDRLHAPGIRTWQITAALAKSRHFVTLCIINFGDFETSKKSGGGTAMRQDLGQNISLIRMSYNPTETASSLRTLHLATRFAAVISTTDIMNAMAADLKLNVPTWLDYNGDPLAEKQLQAHLYQHDGSLLPQWELHLKGLLYGDHFSVCSHPHRYALIGQLAFAGRLTGHNSGEDLVSVIPNSSRFMAEKTPIRSVALKGTQVPATAFLVLWSGGYNTWSDPETLFSGLEKAMQRSNSIYFATTGGAIEGHDTKSFKIFSDLVQNSRFRDRFIFLGWVPTDEVGAYYEQADLAIFTDRPSVEGELGSRTRMIDWIQYEIPIACTQLCELARSMAKQDLIKTFPIGDSEALAKLLLDIAANPEEAHHRAQRAHLWLNSELEEQAMLAPLLKWAENPRFSRDRKFASVENNPEAKWISRLSEIQMDAFTVRRDLPASQTGKDSAGGKESVGGRFRNFFSRKS